MNDNIKAGAEHHAGDGGYSIGTQERYEEFVKLRNRVPNQRIEDLMYHAGLTAQGCWDEMDDYAKQAIERFAELIVKECAEVAQMNTPDTEECEYTHLISEKIREHFGVEE
jgi:hypothetical protein